MAGQSFGERLKAARERAGIKQVDAAEAAGIRPHTLWRYESNEIKSPSIEVIVALARFLGADLEWLLTGDGGPGEWRLTAMVELESEGRLLHYQSEGLTMAEIRDIDRTLSHHGGGATRQEVEAALAQLVAINRGRALRAGAEPEAAREARERVEAAGGPKLKRVLE